MKLILSGETLTYLCFLVDPNLKETKLFFFFFFSSVARLSELSYWGQMFCALTSAQKKAIPSDGTSLTSGPPTPGAFRSRTGTERWKMETCSFLSVSARWGNHVLRTADLANEDFLARKETKCFGKTWDIIDGSIQLLLCLFAAETLIDSCGPWRFHPNHHQQQQQQRADGANTSFPCLLEQQLQSCLHFFVSFSFWIFQR